MGFPQVSSPFSPNMQGCPLSPRKTKHNGCEMFSSQACKGCPPSHTLAFTRDTHCFPWTPGSTCSGRGPIPQPQGLPFRQASSTPGQNRPQAPSEDRSKQDWFINRPTGANDTDPESDPATKLPLFPWSLAQRHPPPLRRWCTPRSQGRPRHHTSPVLSSWTPPAPRTPLTQDLGVSSGQRLSRTQPQAQARKDPGPGPGLKQKQKCQGQPPTGPPQSVSPCPPASTFFLFSPEATKTTQEPFPEPRFWCAYPQK